MKSRNWLARIGSGYQSRTFGLSMSQFLGGTEDHRDYHGDISHSSLVRFLLPH